MTILKFLFAMILSFLPGFLGLLVAPIKSGQDSWYATLNNSVLTPDGWVFSFVWTILYFLIGLALFYVMQKHSKTNRHDRVSAYTLFGLNIVLNTLWTFSFFGMHSPQAAIIVLTALIIVAIFMARSFYRISVPAFWLIVPYILWLMFAFYLNGVIIYLN
ncbi:MAG: tryptophan-rich sensory protein [Alphaproteobacteria bacterium]|nr:tryptophan-rich sensory protein [Alphaproteobacteria bacterium]